MEAALDMDGAFNSVALRPASRGGCRGRDHRRGRPAEERLWRAAYAPARGPTVNRFLSEELRQPATMARLFPTIFLSVAAFLLKRGDGAPDRHAARPGGGAEGLRLLHQCSQSALPRHGRPDRPGGCPSSSARRRTARSLSRRVYQNFYRFPFLDYGIDRGALFGGIGVNLARPLQVRCRRCAAPAPCRKPKAMRPPAPPRYCASHLERLGTGRLLATPGRMVMRELERRPWKALLSVVGLALACAIMMVGRFQRDAIDRMVDDTPAPGPAAGLERGFHRPAGRAALRSPPFRTSPPPSPTAAWRCACVTAPAATTGIEGLPADGVLKRTLDIDLRAWRPPGWPVADRLPRQWLGVAPGDRIEVEVLEDARRAWRCRWRQCCRVHRRAGLRGPGRIEPPAWRRRGHLRCAPAWCQRAAGAGRRARCAPGGRIGRRPRVAGVGARLAAIRSFYGPWASMLVFTFVSLLLGGVINFGCRLQLRAHRPVERGRELASHLRVLGFTRPGGRLDPAGELGTLVALALPGFPGRHRPVLDDVARFQSDLFPRAGAPGRFHLRAGGAHHASPRRCCQLCWCAGASRNWI